MIDTAVARRYAKALSGAIAENVGDGPGADRVATDLEALAATIGRFNGLQLLMQNPAVDTTKKAAVLDEVAERLEASDLTRRFVGVLAARERLQQLPAVARAFRLLADQQEGVIDAQVTAPHTLADNDVADLRDRLAKATGRQVRLSISTDPELLGGLVTRIGDVVYDGSLRYQLERMRAQMIEG